MKKLAANAATLLTFQNAKPAEVGHGALELLDSLGTCLLYIISEHSPDQYDDTALAERSVALSQLKLRTM